MTRRVYSREYTREAAQLVTARGVSVAQAAKDLDVHATVPRRWVREFGSNGPDAFPGKGQLKPEDEELRSLRREVTKLKAECDILKKLPPADRQHILACVRRNFARDHLQMVGFVAKHPAVWPVSWMCDAFSVSRSGLHAWPTRPRSARAIQDERLGAAVRASFVRSDRTYGARRVWHEFLPRAGAEGDQRTCCITGSG